MTLSVKVSVSLVVANPSVHESQLARQFTTSCWCITWRSIARLCLSGLQNCCSSNILIIQFSGNHVGNSGSRWKPRCYSYHDEMRVTVTQLCVTTTRKYKNHDGYIYIYIIYVITTPGLNTKSHVSCRSSGFSQRVCGVILPCVRVKCASLCPVATTWFTEAPNILVLSPRSHLLYGSWKVKSKKRLRRRSRITTGEGYFFYPLPIGLSLRGSLKKGSRLLPRRRILLRTLLWEPSPKEHHLIHQGRGKKWKRSRRQTQKVQWQSRT